MCGNLRWLAATGLITLGLTCLAAAEPPASSEPITPERVNEVVRELANASSERRLALLVLIREWSARKSDSRVDPLTLPSVLRNATLEIAKYADDPSPAIRAAVLTDLGRLRAPAPVARLVWKKGLEAGSPRDLTAIATGMLSYYDRAQEIRDPSSGSARLRLLELFADDVAGTLDLLPMVLRSSTPEARASGWRALSALLDTLDDRQPELSADQNPEAFASFKRNLAPIGKQVAECLSLITAQLPSADLDEQLLMLQAVMDAAEVCIARPERDSRYRQPRGRLMRADLEPEGKQAADAIVVALRELIPALDLVIISGSLEAKLALLSAIEDLGGEGQMVWKLLTHAARDPNRFVRWAAMRAMAKFSTDDLDRVLPVFARGLKDSDLGVRNATCQTVEQFGKRAKALAPDLGKLLMSEDEELTQNAMRALTAMGPDAAPAVPYLIQTLRSENPKLRQLAPPLLGIIGKPAGQEAIPALMTALDDPDPDVRLKAAEALRRLTD
ncbi:MAG TPA: HEAT repeat domain-containing protein [Gemmatales bacterium]|nr:HEAT repeat domain-containing protein [Gemmatales bacterium]